MLAFTGEILNEIRTYNQWPSDFDPESDITDIKWLNRVCPTTGQLIPSRSLQITLSRDAQSFLLSQGYVKIGGQYAVIRPFRPPHKRTQTGSPTIPVFQDKNPNALDLQYCYFRQSWYMLWHIQDCSWHQFKWNYYIRENGVVRACYLYSWVFVSEVLGHSIECPTRG